MTFLDVLRDFGYSEVPFVSKASKRLSEALGANLRRFERGDGKDANAVILGELKAIYLLPTAYGPEPANVEFRPTDTPESLEDLLYTGLELERSL